MEVEIDKFEISLGVDDEKEQYREGNLDQELDEAKLELLIERCVEKLLRQMMTK